MLDSSRLLLREVIDIAHNDHPFEVVAWWTVLPGEQCQTVGGAHPTKLRTGKVTVIPKTAGEDGIYYSGLTLAHKLWRQILSGIYLNI